jgi:hypothetical protein
MRATSGAVLIAVLALGACGGEEASPSLAEPSEAAPTSDGPPASPTAEPSRAEEPASAFAGAWVPATSDEMASVGEWTNKVELADLDLDGDVDILFANGGDYETPGEPVASGAWLNNGDGTFADATAEILGAHALLTRVIKVGDLNADGLPDIVMGTTFDTQSRLLLSTGPMAWTDATATNLPAADLSIGDLELGDVDADSDLDIAITDWGDGNPFDSEGRMQLWRNDGAGAFSDATAETMPETLVGFSWDIELVDVDNDWDLDLAISCKACPGSMLFMNDGSGVFTDETDDRMPAFPNNYEFALIDLDGDGFLDLVTINDGTVTGLGFPEHVFRNDGTGAYQDVTDDWWPPDENPGYDDNVGIALDIDSDGDADFIIGSLDGPDRLLVNDGAGVLTMNVGVFDGPAGHGTLLMAVADLNGDGRPDVVEAQGEVPGHEDERVYLASPNVLEPDTAPPIIRAAVDGTTVLARVHDNRTPNAPHDWQAVVARWDGGEAPLTWYGENLFRGSVPEGAADLEVCAVDAASNEACAAASWLFGHGATGMSQGAKMQSVSASVGLAASASSNDVYQGHTNPKSVQYT